MAMRGVRDADVSSNDLLHAYNFFAISFMKLSVGEQGWDYQGVKTSLRAAFFGVDGNAAHG